MTDIEGLVERSDNNESGAGQSDRSTRMRLPSGNQLPYTQREKSELSNFATIYMLYHIDYYFLQCRFRHFAPETVKARRGKMRQTDTQVGINEQNKRHRWLRYID
jgi:hypothetical protein